MDGEGGQEEVCSKREGEEGGKGGDQVGNNRISAPCKTSSLIPPRVCVFVAWSSAACRLRLDEERRGRQKNSQILSNAPFPMLLNYQTSDT